jgi:hypothetical protein
VRAGDRAPVEGAIVELSAYTELGAGGRLVRASDAEGRFSFDGVPSGRHQLTALADHLATGAAIEVAAEVGQPAENVVVELVGTVTVAGTVVDRESRSPMAGIAVMLATMTVQGPAEATSQADGSFRFVNVLPGKYYPMVVSDTQSERNPDRRPTPIEVAGADVTGLVVEATAGATITGRVLYAGKPVEGAEVRGATFFRNVTTDHAGQFTLRNVPPGTHKLYAESTRVGAFTNRPEVTVVKGEVRTGVEIELDLSGSISGVVVDQNDAPVAGAYLQFSLLRGRDFGQATTADDGSFTTRALSGGGEYVFAVRRNESGSPFPPIAGKRHPPIALRDGQTHVTGVRIKVRVERLVIAGRVIDKSGNAVPDAVVRLEPTFEGDPASFAASRWYLLPTSVSDDTGAFRLRDVPPGRYAVEATTVRGEAREPSVAAGQTNVALRLVENGGIEGTLEGFTAKVDVVAIGLDYRRHLATIAGSTFQIRNLPSGMYRVIATSEGQRVTERIAVESGGTARVTLRKHGSGATGTIAGTVVDATTRKPIASMECTNALDGVGFEDGEPVFVTSDAQGAFRIERAAVGAHQVFCRGKSSMAIAKRVVVAANQVSRVELSTHTKRTAARGHAGISFEYQLAETRVKSLEPDGPAARAGILVGDVLLTIDGAPGNHGEGAIHTIEAHEPGTQVKLTLERDDKELAVTLTLAARPTK